LSSNWGISECFPLAATKPVRNSAHRHAVI
jgi:hypothetical protein